MNEKNLSQLQCLLPIASGAVAFGIFFNPMAANAFSLIPNTSCPSQFPVPNQFLVRLDTSDERPICIFDNRSGDSNPMLGMIDFHRKDGELNVSGTLKKDRVRTVLRSTGARVTGSRLVLTKLNVTNSGNTKIELGKGDQESNFSFIFIQDFFPFKDPAYGSQLFRGSFKPKISTSSATLIGRAYEKQIARQTKKGDFRRASPSRPVDISQAEAKGNLITGNLRELTLEDNTTLNLPNSACIVVLDKQATEKDIEQICEPIPEPSSTISMLTLGVLGGGLLLKRRHKSSNS